ncbi:hypothetical protein D5F01_LYC15291 [Larimichthys crocea]|uniref:Uncharacterized protein n=1 Tax=Larimichthys crocea TaxID=215358 RepID=A0A6G0I340_LARCR|nr:hypothetical protein D5F01_LYC15291 [Larimichthys crocea]
MGGGASQSVLDTECVCVFFSRRHSGKDGQRLLTCTGNRAAWFSTLLSHLYSFPDVAHGRLRPTSSCHHHGKAESVLATFDLYADTHPSLCIGPQIVELDPLTADIGEEIILVAGFKHSQFQVLTSSSAEAIPTLRPYLEPDKGTSEGLSLVLMDHDPQQYLPDLQALEREELLSPSGCSVLLIYRNQSAEAGEVRPPAGQGGRCFPRRGKQRPPCLAVRTRAATGSRRGASRRGRQRPPCLAGPHPAATGSRRGASPAGEAAAPCLRVRTRAATGSEVRPPPGRQRPPCLAGPHPGCHRQPARCVPPPGEAAASLPGGSAPGCHRQPARCVPPPGEQRPPCLAGPHPGCHRQPARCVPAGGGSGLPPWGSAPGLPPAAGEVRPPAGGAAASLPGGSAPGLPPAAGEVRPPAGGSSGLPAWRVRTRAATGSRRGASPRRGSSGLPAWRVRTRAATGSRRGASPRRGSSGLPPWRVRTRAATGSRRGASPRRGSSGLPAWRVRTRAATGSRRGASPRRGSSGLPPWRVRTRAATGSRRVRPPAGGSSGLPPWRVRTRAATGSRRSASPRRGKQRPPCLAGPHPGCHRQPAKCALSVNWFLFINFLDVTDDVTDDVISHMTSPENGARELHVTCDIIGHMTSPVGMLHQHINRICRVRKEVLWEQTVEDPLLLRDKVNYQSDCLLNNSTETGVKRECSLNKLQFYHVTDNVTTDVMHDILEGVGGFKPHTRAFSIAGSHTSSRRHTMASCLQNSVFQWSKEQDFATSAMKAKLASSIVEQFPCLRDSHGTGYDAWFTPGRAHKPATGYLEERLRNVRKRNRKGSRVNSAPVMQATPILLPVLAPTVTYKIGRKVYRPSKLEVRRAFIDIQPPGTNMVQYLATVSSSIEYPYVLMLGEEHQCSQAFVIIGGIALEHPSLLGAVDGRRGASPAGKQRPPSLAAANGRESPASPLAAGEVRPPPGKQRPPCLAGPHPGCHRQPARCVPPRGKQRPPCLAGPHPGCHRQPARCVPPPGEAAASLPGGAAPGLPPAAGEVRPPAVGSSGLPAWRVRTRAATGTGEVRPPAGGSSGPLPGGSAPGLPPAAGEVRPPAGEAAASLPGGSAPGCHRQPARCVPPGGCSGLPACGSHPGCHRQPARCVPPPGKQRPPCLAGPHPGCHRQPARCVPPPGKQRPPCLAGPHPGCHRQPAKCVPPPGKQRPPCWRGRTRAATGTAKCVPRRGSSGLPAWRGRTRAATQPRVRPPRGSSGLPRPVQPRCFPPPWEAAAPCLRVQHPCCHRQPTRASPAGGSSGLPPWRSAPGLPPAAAKFAHQ